MAPEACLPLSAVLMLFSTDLLVVQCLHISNSILLSVRRQSFTIRQLHLRYAVGRPPVNC